MKNNKFIIELSMSLVCLKILKVNITSDLPDQRSGSGRILIKKKDPDPVPAGA